MASDYQAYLLASVGSDVWVPFPEKVAGLTLGDLDDLEVSTNGVALLDPVTEIGLTLFEVDSVNQPGMYYLRLVPDRAGYLFLRFRHTAHEFEYAISVQDPPFSDAGLEGDYTITVDDGTDAVQGASVTIYDAAGTKLIQRGTTDASGEVTFYGLPVGNYQARVFKDGYDFSSINPSTITVVASDAAAPIIDEVLPSTVSIGDHLVVVGRLMDPDDTQVLFGSEATVSPVAVNASGTVALVEVPAGLTSTIIALRVSKSGGATLSNVVTVVLS